MLYHQMQLNNCNVTIEFNWYGEEPEWDTMIVNALLPSTVVPESKYWVNVTDLISDKDWGFIEDDLYAHETALKQQRKRNEY